MENAKSLITSRTFWTSLVSAVLWIFVTWGKPITGIDPGQTADIIVGIIGGFSSLLAIYFRAVADTKIEGVIAPPKE